MAGLVNYLRELGTNEEIDQNIVNQIISSMEQRPFMDDIEFNPPRQFWKYSHLGNPYYEYVYIPWVPEHICYGYISADRDFLSLPFSGCYMAIYINSEYQRCGCHIHLSGIGRADDRRADWNNYINNVNQRQNQNIILYRPNVNLLRPQCQLWGIISNDGEC